MKKNLTFMGGSLGLIFDKLIADLYGIDCNTEVEILPLVDSLIVGFLNRGSRVSDNEVNKVAKDIKKRFGKMMKGLAK